MLIARPSFYSKLKFRKNLRYLLIALASLLAACSDQQEEGRAVDAVEWLKLNESHCVGKGGQMVAIHNKDPNRAIEVWLDRWYMGVKTADRGYHKLAPGATELQLGCSMTDGAEQRWELIGAKYLSN